MEMIVAAGPAIYVMSGQSKYYLISCPSQQRKIIHICFLSKNFAAYPVSSQQKLSLNHLKTVCPSILTEKQQIVQHLYLIPCLGTRHSLTFIPNFQGGKETVE